MTTEQSRQNRSLTPADPLAKLVNPQLAQAALNGTDRFGDFKVIVRLTPDAAQPEGYRPMPYAEGLYAASIPCDRFEAALADAAVVSVELREYVTH